MLQPLIRTRRLFGYGRGLQCRPKVRHANGGSEIVHHAPRTRERGRQREILAIDRHAG